MAKHEKTEGFNADDWDKQFEEDALSGRLDKLGEEALRDLREGRCTDLLNNKPTPTSGVYGL